MITQNQSYNLFESGCSLNKSSDSLWHGQSIGRIAVAVMPNSERELRLKEHFKFKLADTSKPKRWTKAWEDALMNDIYIRLACMQIGNDTYPALEVPRFVHWQSQGITDIFGARVELMEDGNCFTHPLPPDIKVIDDIEVQPIETSLYWNAAEWILYAREATEGRIGFRNPVMTGPIDTANYLLGTTVLLEWVYSEPQVVHRLLEKVTDVIIQMMLALCEASGGNLNPLHSRCMSGGPDLCSELRALISKEIYEEFEAPYLKRIGEKVGNFGIHSCGSWERTVPSALQNKHLRSMNGQIKENDLDTLCSLADGKIALSIGRSIDVHDRYTWPDTQSFMRHVLEVVPDSQPFEVSIAENDIPLWRRLHKEIRMTTFAMPDPVWHV